MADQITPQEFADHMDAFEQRLGARASRTDRRLETIDSRLDTIDGRLDAIDTRLDLIDGRLRAISDRDGSTDTSASRLPGAWPADGVDALAAQIDRCVRLLTIVEQRLVTSGPAEPTETSQTAPFDPDVNAASESLPEFGLMMLATPDGSEALPEATETRPPSPAADHTPAVSVTNTRVRVVHKANGAKVKPARGKRARVATKAGRPRRGKDEPI